MTEDLQQAHDQMCLAPKYYWKSWRGLRKCLETDEINTDRKQTKGVKMDYK